MFAECKLLKNAVDLKTHLLHLPCVKVTNIAIAGERCLLPLVGKIFLRIESNCDHLFSILKSILALPSLQLD